MTYINEYLAVILTRVTYAAIGIKGFRISLREKFVISCIFTEIIIDMGLFNFLNKSQRDVAKEEIVETPWHVLSETEQIDQLLQESEQQPVAIFKHSTRCGISRMVYKQFEKAYTLTDEQAKLYYLDLLNHRDVSNAVAEILQVPHESPQLIILKNREVVHQSSHHSIDATALQPYLS